MNAFPQARPYHHPSELPQEVWQALLQNEAATNVVLASTKRSGSVADGSQLWIALYSDESTVEFVLSCTSGPLGNYPIFIVSSKSSAELAKEEEHLADSLSPLVSCLLEEVRPSPRRIFSVFSLAKVAEKFAEIFEAQAPQEFGIRATKDLLYDATSSFCTSATLKPLDLTSHLQGKDIVIALRRADMSLLDGVAAICKEFSKTSPPYILDDAEARLEAEAMIKNEQAWVHMAQKAGAEPEIACLIAITRESDNVTAVTKVCTVRKWGGHGCATRLLHRVCDDVLNHKSKSKKFVVLYVGNYAALDAARHVYDNVGFQGLSGQQVKGVERWIEIGFEGTDRGHW